MSDIKPRVDSAGVGWCVRTCPQVVNEHPLAGYECALGGAEIICPHHVRRVAEERDRWKAAIEGLTPGGSEYVNDPERCADAIRERCAWPKQIIDQRSKLNRLNKVKNEVFAILDPDRSLSDDIVEVAGAVVSKLNKLREWAREAKVALGEIPCRLERWYVSEAVDEEMEREWQAHNDDMDRTEKAIRELIATYPGEEEGCQEDARCQ